MKVNVQIDINDEDRTKLHRLLSGKDGKGMATRKDVVELCQTYVLALVAQAQDLEPAQPDAPVKRPRKETTPVASTVSTNGDRQLEASLKAYGFTGKQRDNYIRGWQQARERFGTNRRSD